MTTGKALRVGIPIIGYKNWMGGVCYIELLVKALTSLPEPERPHLFLIVTDDSLPRLELHEPILHLFKAIIFVGAYRRDHPEFIYTPGYQELLEVLDFYFPLMNGTWPNAKAACWIPDFQHLHLPHFFHPGERQSRSQNFGAIAQQAKLLVLSSRDAQNDFQRFYPDSSALTRVLSFYALPQESWYDADCAAVQRRYGLPDRFLICCNQFWAHKNHLMLFNAIARLHAQGTEIEVVCTGATEDYRCPNYFDRLKEEVRTLGVEHLVHILGTIPRHDQIQLVRRAMAVVQPSLFEGWSTVIEDCRALGKIMLLSDLPVHLEQAPKDGVYFDRSSLDSLTSQLRGMLPQLSPGPHAARERAAREEAPALVRVFARQFCSIARDALAIENLSSASPLANNASGSVPSPPAGEGQGGGEACTSTALAPHRELPHPLAPSRKGRGNSAEAGKPAHTEPVAAGAHAESGSWPRITIVTPSFNQAQYLEKCILSVLSQNYPNLEYIIMDGGSTDGSLEIIKKYQHRLAYWQSQPDGGQYRAINEGLRRSTGEIMGWLNSDDMLHPGGLQVLADVFSRMPEVEFLTAKRIGFDGNDNLNSYDFETQTWCRDFLLSRELIHDLSLFVMQEATYWRRELWEKAGGSLDLGWKLAGDFELWLRFSRHARLYTVNTLVGGFRYYSSEQRCHQHRASYLAECDAVIDRELSLPQSPFCDTRPPALIPYPLREQKPRIVIKSVQLPKISIVTPSYNQAAFLEECLDSVLSQNYPGLEYIVMDGGSTDGSLEIIRKHEKHLRYWQSRPDGGQYRAVDAGFHRSSGEIMAWLNSDDKYHPGSLWLVADAFTALAEVDWLMGNPSLFNAQGLAYSFSATPPLWSREKYLRGDYSSPYIQQESIFWRRTLWEKAGSCLDTSLELAADLELWARFFRHARLHTLNVPLAGFRTHGEQRSTRLREAYHQEADRVVERERQLWRSSGIALDPAPAPLQMGDLAERIELRISPENFGFFSYSRGMHFDLLQSYASELYGQEVIPQQCDLLAYQYLVAYAFILQNLPPDSRILEIGNGYSPLLEALKRTYHCWQLGTLPPVQLAGQRRAIRRVTGSIGSFAQELPEGDFDLIFNAGSIEPGSPCEERYAAICNDIGQLLKPSGFALTFFEPTANNGEIRSGGLLPYLFRQGHPLHRWVPFEQIALDPFVYAMNRDSFDRHRKRRSGKTFAEYGVPFSYNVLWRPQRPVQGSTAVKSPALRGPALLSRPGVARLSLVIPSYNYGRYLEACLDSILSQNYSNLELIVMDGGSTDNSRAVIERHAKYLAYWQSRPDNGQYSAIEEGLRRSSGELMGWLNADDMFHPGAFETVSTIFSSNREVEWLMGRPNSFDEQGRQKVVLSFLPMNSRAKYLADQELIQQEGIFWRRGLWERSGAYLSKELRLAADLELWARFFRSARLFAVDTLIAGFRDHPLQKSKDKAGYTAEANLVLARERQIFAAERHPFTPPAPLPILVGERPARESVMGVAV